jgi:hypothetical protein
MGNIKALVGLEGIAVFRMTSKIIYLLEKRSKAR